MKPEGLLSPEEARACCEAGYEWLWNAHFPDPDQRPPDVVWSGSRGGWYGCSRPRQDGSGGLVDGSEYEDGDLLGLEPLGWLPMSACPEDERHIFVLFHDKESGRTFASGTRAVGGPYGFRRGGIRFEGWKPVTWPREG